jgi:hypothetical protein
MADYTKRPLYVVGCADLGITIESVEENLTRILRMSTEWNAILLLDEADVFLEQRSTHDLERNGLVSGNATCPWLPMQYQLTALQCSFACSNTSKESSF